MKTIFRFTTNKIEQIEQETDNTKFEGSYSPVVTDALRLEGIKTLKGEITDKFNSVTDYGIVYNGNRYQSGKDSINDIVNAKSLLDASDGGFITWRTYNNQNVVLSYADFLSMALQAGQYYQACFAKRSSLIDSLPNLTNEQLANYDVETEWELIE